MGANKPQATVWRQAAPESGPVIAQTESDGLNSVRELRDLYVQKAEWTERFQKNPNSYYRAAADELNKLLADAAALTVKPPVFIGLDLASHEDTTAAAVIEANATA